MRWTITVMALALASCGDSDACPTCGPEVCGAITCTADTVCDGEACVPSPYGREYVVVLFEGNTTHDTTLEASVSIGGVGVLYASAPTFQSVARWDVAATVLIDPDDAFEVLMLSPDRGVVSLSEKRVPVALLTDGELWLAGVTGGVTLRAFPVGAVPECLRDDECHGPAHCDATVCASGERCLDGRCATDQMCNTGTCVPNPLAQDQADRYTLTIVSADLMDVGWDAGFDPKPDPRAVIHIDGEEVLVAPEQLDTLTATWNVSVTRALDAYSTMRIQLMDVDVTEATLIIDESYNRLPYTLLRDGTLTSHYRGNSLTLTLEPAPDP